MPRMFAASRGASSLCKAHLSAVHRIYRMDSLKQYVLIRYEGMVLRTLETRQRKEKLNWSDKDFAPNCVAVCRSSAYGRCALVFSSRRRARQTLRVRGRVHIVR